jgi:hypothetical protein
MEEWLYFKGAIDLAQLRFPKCRKKIKGLEWGAPLGVWGQTLWWQLIQKSAQLGLWEGTDPSAEAAEKVSLG